MEVIAKTGLVWIGLGSKLAVLRNTPVTLLVSSRARSGWQQILGMAFLGNKFVTGDGKEVDLAYVQQAKVVMVLYTATW